MEKKVKVVGYGDREGEKLEGVLLEVTKRSIWLKMDGGRSEFRIRDGKKVGDSFRSGLRVHPDDLKIIPGRRK